MARTGLKPARFLYGIELAQAIRAISRKSRSRLWIASPYVGASPRQLLPRALKHVPDIRFVIDFSARAVRSGATNPYGVKSIMGLAQVRRLDNLHAKLYISDNEAIITSANLSARAFTAGSLEVGMIVRDESLVEAISKFFETEIQSSSAIIDDETIERRIGIWRRSREMRAFPSEANEKRVIWRPNRVTWSKSEPVGTELVMDVLEETRETQVQIPVQALIRFFNVGADERAYVTLRHRNQTKRRPIVQLPNKTHRLEIDAIRNLARPLIMKFARDRSKRNTYEYELFERRSKRFTTMDRLLRIAGTRTRAGSRRWFVR